LQESYDKYNFLQRFFSNAAAGVFVPATQKNGIAKTGLEMP
jgi:hypothetical protein